jgi:hypothetical protein
MILYPRISKHVTWLASFANDSVGGLESSRGGVFRGHLNSDYVRYEACRSKFIY